MLTKGELYIMTNDKDLKYIQQFKKELVKNKKYYLLLAILLLVTILIRFTPIVTGNFPFLFDTFHVSAKALVQPLIKMYIYYFNS